MHKTWSRPDWLVRGGPSAACSVLLAQVPQSDKTGSSFPLSTSLVLNSLPLPPSLSLSFSFDVLFVPAPWHAVLP